MPLLPLPPLPLSPPLLRCLLFSASSQVLKRGSSGVAGWPSCFSCQSLPPTCVNVRLWGWTIQHSHVCQVHDQDDIRVHAKLYQGRRLSTWLQIRSNAFAYGPCR